MLLISSTQVRQLEQVRLTTFFKRTEEYIARHVREATVGGFDLPGFIRSQYPAAVEGGCRTERDVVHYLLNILATTV